MVGSQPPSVLQELADRACANGPFRSTSLLWDFISLQQPVLAKRIASSNSIPRNRPARIELDAKILAVYKSWTASREKNTKRGNSGGETLQAKPNPNANKPGAETRQIPRRNKAATPLSQMQIVGAREMLWIDDDEGGYFSAPHIDAQ